MISPEANTLWRTFANAHRAAVEIDALHGELGLLLEDIKPEFIVEDTGEYGGLSDSDEWVYHYVYYVYSVRSRLHSPRLRQLGNVTFAVSFWRDADERTPSWRGAETAKYYQAFCPYKDEWWDKDLLFIDGCGAPGDQNSVAQPPYLWCYKEEDGLSWHQRKWFYGLSLDGLRTREDLERELITPLRCLLRGMKQEDAFKDVKYCFHSADTATR